MALQEPWRRVKSPAPLPVFAGASDLRAIDDDTFAILLRDHLLPLNQERKYNAHWRNFWNVIAFDDQLATRANDILEDFITTARQALDAGALEPAQVGRAEKFIDKSTMALDRLDRVEGEPLAWAGARAVQFNPRSREVIDRLVTAIAKHRRTGNDEELWQVLNDVGLDPDKFRRNRH